MSPQALAYILDVPVKDVIEDPQDGVREVDFEWELAEIAAGNDGYGGR